MVKRQPLILTYFQRMVSAGAFTSLRNSSILRGYILRGYRIRERLRKLPHQKSRVIPRLANQINGEFQPDTGLSEISERLDGIRASKYIR